MRNLKAVIGLIGTLVAVLYCGRLLYYFIDLSGSVQEAEEIGLGPTVLGLGAVGLLFCIPLIVKIFLMFATRRSPGSGGHKGPPDTSKHDDEDKFEGQKSKD